jgi:hypothetical protein
MQIRKDARRKCDNNPALCTPLSRDRRERYSDIAAYPVFPGCENSAESDSDFLRFDQIVNSAVMLKGGKSCRRRV